MKTVGLFMTPAGKTVTLRFARPDPKVVAYVVFLVRYTGGGEVNEGAYHPEELESAAGASFVTESAIGYDLILKAQIAADASIAATLVIDGATVFNEPLALPAAEGAVVTREWSIVIK